MKNIKILLIALLLIVTSCKEQEKPLQDFVLEANNNVDIPVSNNVKNALNYLSNIKIRIVSSSRLYHVDFYFNITQQAKELIVIEYFKKFNGIKEYDISESINKYTIPIQKIGNTDIMPEYLNELNYNVDPSNKDVLNLNIEMEYGSNSIIDDVKVARSEHYYSSDDNKQNNNTCDNVILIIPKNQIFNLKKSIDILVSEYKL